MNTELTQLREENVRLRNKLLALAKECQSCDGTGIVTVLFYNEAGDQCFGREEPCGDCADIRGALA